MQVRNMDDARIAFELIGIYGQERAHNPHVVNMKREVRRFLRSPATSQIIKDDGMDGYVELVQLPEKLDGYDLEAAEEWFKGNREIPPTYSAYDCTGTPFTSWYKIFRRRGHWFAYHSVAYDV